jgi:RimJ/RimL family protein N-acetyltransferase
MATANAASQRVAEKLGATREGVLRNRILIHDQVHDAVMFSLIPSDRIELG